MRNELFTDKIGTPCNNKVLVEVSDIFDGFKTDSGLYLPNMAHEETWGDSPGYSFSEFVVRHGTVVGVPKIVTSGSFDYDTEIELQKGDIAYWNIATFRQHIPIVMDKRVFLLVDYHEILLRVRGEDITPINGNVLFAPVMDEHKYGLYTNVIGRTTKWKIVKMPEKLPTELNPRYYNDVDWQEGETVMLSVLDKPFKIEGDILKSLPEKLYACPARMIMCTIED